MTYEEKTRRLREYGLQRRLVQELNEELEELRQQLDLQSAAPSGLPGTGPDPTRLARGVEKLERQRALLARQEQQAREVQEGLEEAIESLPDPRRRRLLRLLYFTELKQEGAAEQLGCCRRIVAREHRAALEQLFEPRKKE